MANLNIYIPENIITCTDGEFSFVTCKNSCNNIINEKVYNYYLNQQVANINTIDNTIISEFTLDIDKGFSTEHKVFIKDPRGFIVPIYIENFLDILKYCSYNHETRQLSGEFVYGLYTNTLTIIPVNSEEYKKALDFYNSTQLSISECIPGKYYKFNDTDELLYLGNILTINNINKNNITTYIPNKYHIFKSSNSRYIEYNTTKRTLIEVHNKSQVSSDDLNTELQLYYKHKFNNSTILDSKFKKLTNILPNTTKLSTNFDNVIKDIHTPYKEWEIVLGGYTVNNISDISHKDNINFELWLFNEDYTSVTHYYNYRQLEVDGLNKDYYSNIHQLPNDEINNIFRTKGQRCIYIYPSTSYIINDNKLIQRNPLEKLSNRLIKDVEGFINKYKDTGRLFVVYEKYVSIDNILILKADNNYNFKAFIK